MTSRRVELRVLRLPKAADLPLPSRASEGSAGLDLRAAVEDDVVVPAGGRAAIDTGLVLEIPPGWEAQVRPRSGLADRHGITLTNSPGTIDSDYRGEVRILLVNLGREPFTVRRGDRIAQIVVMPVPEVEVVEVTDVLPTGRGGSGFGSTGIV